MLREPEIFHVLDFLFSASFFGSYSFYTLLTLFITLLGCHLSVPLSSSRQPVGEGSLETLTDYMYDVPTLHTYRPYRMYEAMSCLGERGSGFVTCL